MHMVNIGFGIVVGQFCCLIYMTTVQSETLFPCRRTFPFYRRTRSILLRHDESPLIHEISNLSARFIRYIRRADCRRSCHA